MARSKRANPQPPPRKRTVIYELFCGKCGDTIKANSDQMPDAQRCSQGHGFRAITKSYLGVIEK